MGRILKNPRQERFVKLYLQEMAVGGTASAAYKKVYHGAKGFNCANAGAHNLLKKPHVQSRIKEMRMDIKRKADITFEKILSDYQEAMDLAREKGEPANIISAAREQAKLVGLLIDRKEVGSAGDFENMENISEILQAVSDQAGPEAALALSQAFQLIGPTVVIQQQKAPEETPEALLDAESPSDAVN
jgi:hypothetical protein